MKGGRWINRRYFHAIGSRSREFSSGTTQEDGTKDWFVLRKAADVAIERHGKIQGAANPYDPEFEVYFEDRAAARLLKSIEGNRQLTRLWERQGGHCPVCAQPINLETEWDDHLLIRKVDGGSDALSNRVLLHPACHRQGHASKSGFTFVLPV